jgi:hypothetical protein
MTRAASISTYGALQTWHRGCYPLEAALIRDAEAVDAREEVSRDVVAESDETCASVPATLFDEVAD